VQSLSRTGEMCSGEELGYNWIVVERCRAWLEKDNCVVVQRVARTGQLCSSAELG